MPTREPSGNLLRFARALVVAAFVVAPFVVAPFVVGCRSKPRGAPPSTTSATSAVSSSAPEIEPSLTPSIGAAPFTATLEGTPLAFKTAWIVGTSYGWLFLSTGDTPCSIETNGVTRLEVDLRAGPNDALYAGHPIAVAVSIDPLSEKKKLAESWIGNTFATLTLDAGATWKKGAHVRGTLEFSYERERATKVLSYVGKGAFDAVVCDDRGEGWWQGGPAKADAGDVAGSYGDAKLATKDAIAILMHDDLNDVDYIDTIRFYASDVSCDTREAAEAGAPYLQLSGPVPGANTRQRFVGTTQPASFYYVTPPESEDATAQTHAVDGDGWVKLDALELSVGGTIRGSMFVASAKSEPVERRGRFSGNFRAKVCRW